MQPHNRCAKLKNVSRESFIGKETELLKCKKIDSRGDGICLFHLTAFVLGTLKSLSQSGFFQIQ